jgi:hypothetical protein
MPNCAWAPPAPGWRTARPRCAIALLETLAREQPGFRPEQMGILLGKAYAAAGRQDEAGSHFATAAHRFGSLEARAELAIWALANGKPQVAEPELQEIERTRRHMPGHARKRSCERRAIQQRRLHRMRPAEPVGAPPLRAPAPPRRKRRRKAKPISEDHATISKARAAPTSAPTVISRLAKHSCERGFIPGYPFQRNFSQNLRTPSSSSTGPTVKPSFFTSPITGEFCGSASPTISPVPRARQ